MLAVAIAACSSGGSAGTGQIPLRQVGEVALTGGSARFDYAALDAGAGLLFIAHMGAGEVVEVDIRAHRVIRTIPNVPDVHGVLVVPERRRIYVTATGRNQMVTIDEDTGSVLHTSPTDNYPDGLAYDPRRGAVWTTNESAGSETVIDADTGSVRGTVEMGGAAGNVVYDPATDRMVVAVQGRNDLALVDPAALKVVDRIAVPDCDHPHGQALAPAERLLFVGCQDNATLITLDLATRAVLAHNAVGDNPDVLVYDQSARRLYVAAESGWVSVFDQRGRNTTVVGSRYFADSAHSLAVDPDTHRSFFPLPRGASGGPVLREFEPTN